MTYPFKFPDTAPPTLTVGRSRTVIRGAPSSGRISRTKAVGR